MQERQRFQIRRHPLFRPLLVLFGATEANSTVEVHTDVIVTRFGWHCMEIPCRQIVSVEQSNWPWYAGIGWRSNLRSTLGLIGSYDGIVNLELDPSVRVRLLGIPFGLRHLYISLDDPSAFLAVLSTRTSMPSRAGARMP